jgi:hypothetical protein
MSATKPAGSAATGIVSWQMPALIIGVIGLAACAVGWMMQPQEFFRSYLPAYIFWFDIVAGALGVLCLQYTTGGEWGLLIRRPLGAAARTMIAMAVLFIPIVLGMKYIYSWADQGIPGHSEAMHFKQQWLEPKAWIIRSAIYFAIWILWAWRIRILSLRFYEDRSPYTELSRRRWSAAGLLMIVLTLTFASIDWVMSLEPLWFSSMYGISFTIGAGLSAFVFVTLLLTQLAKTEAMANVVKPSHFRDLGNLMFAFIMLWAYTAFSQFLLIWYANLKEEVPYYLRRQHGAWGMIAGFLIVFHFFVPFFMLLMRTIKDRPQTLAIVTIILLVMRFVDVYWLTAPAFSDHFHFSIWTIAALAGIGGIWLWAFIQQLKGQTIIPIHESWVDEAIREGALTRHA